MSGPVSLAAQALRSGKNLCLERGDLDLLREDFLAFHISLPTQEDFPGGQPHVMFTLPASAASVR